MSQLKEQVLEAWHRLGSKAAVARELGINPKTVYKHLKNAGIGDTPVATGRVHYLPPQEKELPPEGEVARYILTCAQNNTKLHKRFWDSLVTYANHLGAELMVSRFTYNKASYSSAKSVKPGKGPTSDDKDKAWWDRELDPYICDDAMDSSGRWQLAPGLLWCAEMNILPTAARPLSGLQTYTGSDSGIFPHSKIAMESVATARYEPAKFNYTTGCVTQRNYIAKKTGLKAEFHHTYGALIVEVLSDGRWWVRQLNADARGRFYDCAEQVVFVEPDRVTPVTQVAAVNWGDVHASEIDEDVKIANWGEGGIIDVLRPKKQIMHDLLSFRSRGHHDMKSFGVMYQKFLGGEDSVEDEVNQTKAVADMAHREFCEMVVVNSNHDRHGERWLDEADYRKDLLNAEYFLEAQLARIRAYKMGAPWDFHKWSLQHAGVSRQVRFLERNESYQILGIECGLHGDEGPNGSRGTTANLSRLGARVNKGHDHSAAILDGVYSAGSCAVDLPYMNGPSSHSASHIVTYPNGKRTIITLRGRDWRAAGPDSKSERT
ncbi:gp05 [Alphaproteobacteria phage PhiJL001]|uniref:Gp05 n=1 Tax=Alphaproteobacteria phage PhiJL001 TaxID=2681607 RepID=Q5DNA0_9CAUD|nr:DNA transfer protein [Alphaproteobacteria phage PhiJL001]AAT69465.1 gp05 [Alphaproteobacteria phage PhiJL001]